MKLLVWGLNYKTVPIMIRESFSLSPELITKVLDSRLYEPYVPEVVILSTCNRTEIYAVGDDSITGKRFSPSLRLYYQMLRLLTILMYIPIQVTTVSPMPCASPRVWTRKYSEKGRF